jgi:hypothetical protein
VAGWSRARRACWDWRTSRPEGDSTSREDYLVPLTACAEGWSTLDALIQRLIDRNFHATATVNLEVDGHVRAAMERRCSVIIVGRPRSGKTRLAWQLLQERPQTIVVALNPTSSRPLDKFEGSGLTGCQVVLLFNGLHKTAETMQPRLWR